MRKFIQNLFLLIVATACTQHKSGKAEPAATLPGDGSSALQPQPAPGPVVVQTRPDNTGVAPTGWLAGALFASATITVNTAAQPAGISNLPYQYCALSSPYLLNQLLPAALPNLPLPYQNYFYWFFADHDPAAGAVATQLAIRIDTTTPVAGDVAFSAATAPANTITLISSQGHSAGTWTSSMTTPACTLTVGNPQESSQETNKASSGANPVPVQDFGQIYVTASLACSLRRDSDKATLRIEASLGCQGPWIIVSPFRASDGSIAPPPEAATMSPGVGPAALLPTPALQHIRSAPP